MRAIRLPVFDAVLKDDAMTVMVTGAAGFIGFHVSRALLARGEAVIGVDAVTDYYDPALKEARLAILKQNAAFAEERLGVENAAGLRAVFERHRPDRVIHLAAQAGVRYSVENPSAYAQSNLVGFLNILENCRHFGVGHLVYASTSSIYGANETTPFEETHGVGHPISLYAATKRANEVMAHSYSHLFRFPATGLRFFTVYGPWGRPDMALFKFTKAILSDESIEVYNHGRMKRDFTYVADVVEGVVRILDKPAAVDPHWSAKTAHPDPSRSGAGPFRLFNIGRGAPTPLMEFVRVLERKLGREAKITFTPMRPGDVAATFADASALKEAVGYRPLTSVEEGVGAFVDWYRGFYRV